MDLTSSTIPIAPNCLPILGHILIADEGNNRVIEVDRSPQHPLELRLLDLQRNSTRQPSPAAYRMARHSLPMAATTALLTSIPPAT